MFKAFSYSFVTGYWWKLNLEVMDVIVAGSCTSLFVDGNVPFYMGACVLISA